ncbi:CLUMA_CG017775, isoform A [Clunio marinus]|uniref:CLUMA_CG017775, isoform A n=1 Tax=Clunio marinus TaxID=568069 RepID=A0A1J1IWQ5_9DIPT|nr:CLUMA_CG017775, isoform A [Clunio marinus]
MEPVKKHKKHKKHKSERKSKYDERPPSLKLILKVNGTPEYGSSDSPYNAAIHHPDHSSSMLFDNTQSHSEHGEKHKKSKKKKKKKDREKKHKHHKKDRHHRHGSSGEDATLMDDDDSSQLMTESAQLYYSAMSTSSAISSNPVTKPMIPLQDHPKVFHTLQNVPSVSSVETKPETPLGHQDSPMTPSSMDSGTREPRTCVLKLKQSRSPLAKLLDHLLKALEKRDPHQFFAWPVTDDIAPGYSSIITRPMDFSTIRQKIEENEYHLLTDFIEDFRLMCDNAIRYNHHETVYNKAARRLLQAGMRLLQPENLTRGPVAIFLKDLSIKELGFDPTIKLEHHDEAYSVDSADEGATSALNDQPDPHREERERRERMKVELDPKTAYEPFVDNLTPDEILEQVQKASRSVKARLSKKRAHSMGFLRTHHDGTTSMTILVPSESGIPEKTKKIGELTGKLQKGTGLLQSFREDRRNIVKLPKLLDYGAFSTFAPTFDSRFTNLTKEETELILNTYGDENGANYATSIGRFTKDSAYGNALANRLLDLLTNGEHSKTMEVLMESENVKQVQKEVDELLPDYQKESKRLENVTIDFDQLKSLKDDLGVDISFLTEFEKTMKEPVKEELQTKLDSNTSLIEQLHQVQHERLSAPIQQHLSLVPHPNKQEVELADQITSNLTMIAKKLPPCAIASTVGVRKAMGISPAQLDDDARKIPINFNTNRSSKESLVDTTPIDMDLEPPVVSTFDNELRELLGTD